VADRIVLVHSPLVGAATWELVAPVLAGDGHEVLVPDLTGTLATGPPYCSRQAEVIAGAAAGDPAVLAGHSGAGSLLAQAGSSLENVRGYVFVDAGLPTPGQSWMQAMPAEVVAQVREMADPQGWLPPWSQWWGADGLAELLPDPQARRRFAAGCPRLPLAMFEEPHPPAPRWQQVPAAYLRLSEGYDEPAGQARAQGWPVAELASHHLAPFTDPGPVADALLQLIASLHQQPR
jgi:hypothetical protein